MLLEKEPPDMLDIVISDISGDGPIEYWDIEDELEERGIIGYTELDIKHRIEELQKKGHFLCVRNGYIRNSEEIFSRVWMVSSFRQVRKPSWKILSKDKNPMNHSYIEDGLDTEERQSIPVPPGSRVFCKIYGFNYTKYFHEFVSHIYAYQYKDGPVQTVDFWFAGTGRY